MKPYILFTIIHIIKWFVMVCQRSKWRYIVNMCHVWATNGWLQNATDQTIGKRRNDEPTVGSGKCFFFFFWGGVHTHRYIYIISVLYCSVWYIYMYTNCCRPWGLTISIPHERCISISPTFWNSRSEKIHHTQLMVPASLSHPSWVSGLKAVEKSPRSQPLQYQQ